MTDVSTAVCIATTGRTAILTETLRHVCAQSRPPDRILVCYVQDTDVDLQALAALPYPVETLKGTRGLAAQRNILLRASAAPDVVLFLDDDFFIDRHYVATMVEFFRSQPHAVILTGTVLRDGASGPGLTVEEGRATIDAPDRVDPRPYPAYNAYGCNMAVNWRLLKDKGCWFDEQLPLYAWGEDVDFSRQAAIHGGVFKHTGLLGVHLGTKQGKVSGVKFGYSQIANQVYLVRKGTIPVMGALRKAIENVLANLHGAIRNHEYFIDRRGRLVGNLRALGDGLTGRMSPRRILDL